MDELKIRVLKTIAHNNESMPETVVAQRVAERTDAHTEGEIGRIWGAINALIFTRHVNRIRAGTGRYWLYLAPAGRAALASQTTAAKGERG